MFNHPELYLESKAPLVASTFPSTKLDQSRGMINQTDYLRRERHAAIFHRYVDDGPITGKQLKLEVLEGTTKYVLVGPLCSRLVVGCASSVPQRCIIRVNRLLRKDDELVEASSTDPVRFFCPSGLILLRLMHLACVFPRRTLIPYLAFQCKLLFVNELPETGHVEVRLRVRGQILKVFDADEVDDALELLLGLAFLGEDRQGLAETSGCYVMEVSGSRYAQRND
jgi:hypothetical protein